MIAERNNWPAFFTMVFFTVLMAETGRPQEGRLRLVHADSLKGVEVNGVSVIEVSGHVVFEQDSMRMTCWRARQIAQQSRIEFYGDVNVHEGEKWLRSDSLIYYENRKVQEALGNVALGDRTNQLTAKKVTYFQNQDLAVAERDVVMTNSERRLVLTCGRADYNIEDEYAKATISPVVIEMDSAQNEQMRITGEVIEMYEGGNRTKAHGKVNITRQNTNAKCEEAEYFRADGRLELRVDPVAWQAGDELKGDEIEMFFEEQKITRAHVKGKAQMTSPVDSLANGEQFNTLSGGQMALFFGEEQIEKIVVDETATSVYHVVENGEDQGMNRVQGDRITLLVRNKELQQVMIESDPGVATGRFMPEGFALQDSGAVKQSGEQ